MEPSQHEHSEGEVIKTSSKSPLWQYVEIIGKNPGGGSFKWKCNECQDIKIGSYTRMKVHFTGQTNAGVQVCIGTKDANGKLGQGLGLGKMNSMHLCKKSLIGSLLRENTLCKALQLGLHCHLSLLPQPIKCPL